MLRTRGSARIGIRLVVFGLALCALACKEPEPAATLPPSLRFTEAGDHTVEITVGTLLRSFILHLPPGFPSRGPLPVLIAYHGGAGNARQFKRHAGLDAKADETGTVVIYPNGTTRFGRLFLTWNAGACCGYAQDKNIDDVAFTFAILADLARDLPLDRTRVYATGHSNGAMMAYRLAGEAAPRIAAIVPVAGADATLEFAPTAPVPVLQIHSIDDPRALYGGGTTPILGDSGRTIDHRSVEAGLARWRERDGCTGAGTETEKRADGGHTAVLLDYAPCAGGMDVALWKLTGPGHAWPGSATKRVVKLLGPNTKVVLAGDEVFKFIVRFSKPDAPELVKR